MALFEVTQSLVITHTIVGDLRQTPAFPDRAIESPRESSLFPQHPLRQLFHAMSTDCVSASHETESFTRFG